MSHFFRQSSSFPRILDLSSPPCPPCPHPFLIQGRIYLQIYQSGKTVDDVINGLQVSAEKLFKWFSDNQMKGNADKCHLIMSTENAPELQIGDSFIKASSCEKLLGVKIDYKLTFDEHVKVHYAFTMANIFLSLGINPGPETLLPIPCIVHWETQFSES